MLRRPTPVAFPERRLHPIDVLSGDALEPLQRLGVAGIPAEDFLVAFRGISAAPRGQAVGLEVRIACAKQPDHAGAGWRLRRHPVRGRRDEVEAPQDQPLLPGRLPAASARPDLSGRALEHLLHGQPRPLERAQELAGEHTVAPPRVVVRHLARLCGVQDQGAAGRVHVPKTPGGAAEAARIGVVAASIQDHQVQPVARPAHPVQDPPRVDRLVTYVGLVADLRADGHQVVLAVDLHAVTGVVEQAHRASTAETAGEFSHRLFHLPLAFVEQPGHGEAEPLEGGGHVTRVVHGVAQLAPGVRGVADDQGDTTRCADFVPFSALQRPLAGRGCGKDP